MHHHRHRHCCRRSLLHLRYTTLQYWRIFLPHPHCEFHIVPSNAYIFIYFLHLQFGSDSGNNRKTKRRKIDRNNTMTTTTRTTSIELFIFWFRLYLVLCLHWLVSKQYKWNVLSCCGWGCCCLRRTNNTFGFCFLVFGKRAKLAMIANVDQFMFFAFISVKRARREQLCRFCIEHIMFSQQVQLKYT